LLYLNSYNAVDVAIPATDTIIKTSDGCIEDIPDRSRLMQGQTPQGFRLGTIRRAYEKSREAGNYNVSCDCGVVRTFLNEEKIGVVQGHSSNIKITNAEDIFLADKLFQIISDRRNFLHNDTYYSSGLKGKVIVVFGGSYGIGKEIGERCKEYGAKVYSLSRSGSGTHVESFSDVENALTLVNDQEGKIDFVINTAGILVKEPLNHMSQQRILELVNVNYIGAVNVAKASYRYLKSTNGQLVLFTSSSYTRGRAHYAIYSSSKAAIVNLSQAIAEEWHSDGVKVNCINPQRTNTPMRVKNFGAEPEESLLKASDVAIATINVMLENFTGQVIDVKLN
jgi:2-C-methyl-D-erythritol 4-phosphate cytidylyltransferase